MVVDGYRITKVYPHIVIGENEKGEKCSFQIAYALLNAEQKAEQNEYWDSIEAEFHRRSDIFESNIRPAQPVYY